MKEAVHLCLSNSYKNIYFISKSLGTTIADEISKSLGYDKVNNFFLTPIVNTIEYIASTKCTVIVGSKDKQFSKEHIEKINLFPWVDLQVIDNTSHSLEVEGSCKCSLEILSRVTNLYENFVCKNRI